MFIFPCIVGGLIAALQCRQIQAPFYDGAKCQAAIAIGLLKCADYRSADSVKPLET